MSVIWFFFQYEKEEQQQNMTDLKLKNDSDRLQLGMCFS